MTKDEALRLALEALGSNRRTHHYCEDTWYSCPKHEDGCANDSEGDECNCGADKANAGIDQAITAIKQALATPVQDSTCNETLRAQGKAYPRTCRKCGLGPCIGAPKQPHAQPAPVQEAFGYFKAEPFGWIDCDETDEGAIALYEHPAAQPAQEENQHLRALVRAQQITIDKLEQALAAPVAHRDRYWCVDLTCKKCYGADFRFKHTTPPAQPALVQKRPQNCGTGYCSCIECVMEPAPVQEPVAFKIYKPTPPRGVIPNVRDAELPWVYDQDPSSGNVASMWVTPVQTLRSKS